jgi:mono/diheme cytochrome c family protein
MKLTLPSSCVAPASCRRLRGRLAPGESGPEGRRSNHIVGYLPVLLLAIMSTVGCRLDMHVQPRYNPLAKSDFFSDQRAARPLVEGTVARGDERADTYFYTGKIGNNPGEYMPFPVTKEVMERGRERFNIYCAPCHSTLGDGNGFVPTRGFSKKPPSYHNERLMKVPLGYFFDVMTNGYGIMQDYSAQVSPHDRWCIAAYIRALQLSQNATSADIPPGQSVPSKAPEFVEPGSGATLPQVAPNVKSGKGESE